MTSSQLATIFEARIGHLPTHIYRDLNEIPTGEARTL